MLISMQIALRIWNCEVDRPGIPMPIAEIVKMTKDKYALGTTNQNLKLTDQGMKKRKRLKQVENHMFLGCLLFTVTKNG
jgi:hypothetical protein